jgi:hypothetical protein
MRATVFLCRSLISIRANAAFPILADPLAMAPARRLAQASAPSTSRTSSDFREMTALELEQTFEE